MRLEPFPVAGTGKGAGGVELVNVGLQLQTRAFHLGLSRLSRLLCDAQVAGSGRECINPKGIENRRRGEKTEGSRNPDQPPQRRPIAFLRDDSKPLSGFETGFFSFPPVILSQSLLQHSEF